MKKGQGMSLNTIIIAAIVLIVLVVLWAIFTGRMGLFSNTLNEQTGKKECGDEGGKEVRIDECKSPDFPLFGNYNVNDGYVCCRKGDPVTQ